MVPGGFSKGLALLATTTALALLSQTANAAILPRQSNEALRPWVTVAPDGAAKTITPTVNDGKTTSTFTGSTTLPTANAQGAGTFLLCDQAAGSSGLSQPFCSPKTNSELEGGKTYWGEKPPLSIRRAAVLTKGPEKVTWDADLFPSPNTMVQVQGDYGVTRTIEAGHGFTSQMMPASQGHYAWAAVGYNMAPDESLDVQLVLAVPATNGTITGRHVGPRVRIVNRSRPPPPRRRGPNVLGIVLPIVFGVLSLGGIGWFVWWYGRRKGMFHSRGRGYGVGKSRVQRTADVKIGLGDSAFSSQDRGVEMMPPPARPPPPSSSEGNVFRHELERQERNERAQTML
ncbi:hypothetical protein CTA2_6430 [Colletotrichum tanaceti]|uniref:Uncharacterized protein n=1 Tax=Colletotrichum tanaceti TaxID=1306861 RepID=A0A4V6DFR1_9PEZI|nr:hypothetical protein CTA2_6430 [Colletotrichum tanaceti]TKW50096.1 hypothetical protein CTA1_3906 [Colletotrichum tanaceti]